MYSEFVKQASGEILYFTVFEIEVTTERSSTSSGF